MHVSVTGRTSVSETADQFVGVKLLELVHGFR